MADNVESVLKQVLPSTEYHRSRTREFKGRFIDKIVHDLEIFSPLEGPKLLTKRELLNIVGNFVY